MVEQGNKFWFIDIIIYYMEGPNCLILTVIGMKDGRSSVSVSMPDSSHQIAKDCGQPTTSRL
jgi:hypothetical protein